VPVGATYDAGTADHRAADVADETNGMQYAYDALGGGVGGRLRHGDHGVIAGTTYDAC